MAEQNFRWVQRLRRVDGTQASTIVTDLSKKGWVIQQVIPVDTFVWILARKRVWEKDVDTELPTT